ncbi:MAG: PAS domain-containing protein [Cyanobacteriota bacterium]|nr:PAS domain-containing protein [Cyanobacteriota bacterium]
MSYPILAWQDLAALVKQTQQAQNPLDLLQKVGYGLQQFCPGTRFWIGSMMSLEAPVIQGFWAADPDHPQELFATQLHCLRPQLLQELQATPQQVMVIPPDQGGWIAEYTPLEGEVSPQKAIHSPPLHLGFHLVGLCKGQRDPSWLVGLWASHADFWTPTFIDQMQVILLFTELVLARYYEEQRSLSQSQQHRSTANRLMDWLRISTEASRQVIYEWDMQQGQMEWSLSLRTVFGHSITADSERRFWWVEQIHPSDRPQVLKQLDSCLRDLQTFLCEYRWLRADGFYAWVRDYGRIFSGPQGKAVRIVGSLEDITPRRHTTTALQQVKQGLRISLNLSSVALAVVDTQFRVLEANQALQSLLGYSLADLQKLETLTLITHPADLNVDEQMMAKWRQQKLTSYTVEKRFFHANGEEVASQVTVHGLGSPVGSTTQTELQLLWEIRPIPPQD